MLGNEKGTCEGSDLYFATPSETARSMLFYMSSCGYYRTDYEYHIERDDYQNFLIFCILDGRLSVTSENRTMVAESGQIGFLDCHEPHEYHTIGHTEFLWLHLDGSNIRDFYNAIIKQKGGFVFSAESFETVKQLLYEIVSTYRIDQIPHEAALSGSLYRILTELLNYSGGAADGDEQESNVKMAIRFIQKNYGEKISLEDVARHVNMSLFHFARVFKKSCGYSPHEFLILTRINHAKHLLKTTELPIKVIAQMVGYQNATTFTNAFTNRVAISPTRFRKYPI